MTILMLYWLNDGLYMCVGWLCFLIWFMAEDTGIMCVWYLHDSFVVCWCFDKMWVVRE